MARTKPAQLRDMGVADLQKKNEELRRDLYEMRRKQATGQVDNPARIRSLRRERARVLTIMGEQAKEKKP